jgi:polysaccharide export outer membrane protein
MRVSLKNTSVIIGAAFILGATLCAAQSEVTSPASQPPASPAPGGNAKTNPKTPAPPSESSRRYVIGPLDVLNVKVWNQPQLSEFIDVRPDGMISMPLIGEVKADGLTARQLTETLKARLGEFLNNPEVDVQVTKVNSKRYYVYGGVLKPGEFPLVGTTTVMDALSMVGGFKDFAKPGKIRIQRGNQTFNFNYNDFSKGKNMDKNMNIELQNGDRIYVPE